MEIRSTTSPRSYSFSHHRSVSRLIDTLSPSGTRQEFTGKRHSMLPPSFLFDRQTLIHYGVEFFMRLSMLPNNAVSELFFTKSEAMQRVGRWFLRRLQVGRCLGYRGEFCGGGSSIAPAINCWTERPNHDKKNRNVLRPPSFQYDSACKNNKKKRNLYNDNMLISLNRFFSKSLFLILCSVSPDPIISYPYVFLPYPIPSC